FLDLSSFSLADGDPDLDITFLWFCITLASSSVISKVNTGAISFAMSEPPSLLGKFTGKLPLNGFCVDVGISTPFKITDTTKLVATEGLQFSYISTYT